MTMDNFKDRLEGNLAAFYHDPDTDNSLNRAYNYILLLLIPTLNWKDNPNVSFSTGGGKMCVIRKTDDSYTTTAPVGFTGTLNECKHYCSVWVRDEYLKLCGNGQNA